MKDKYLEVSGTDLWARYATGVFRGGGNATDVKLYKAAPPEGVLPVRDTDFLIVPATDEHGQPYLKVVADGVRGLSFADAPDTLARKRILGQVWKLPAGAVLPPGLRFIYKPGEEDHPLLTVGTDMRLEELVGLLAALSRLMVKDVKLK